MYNFPDNLFTEVRIEKSVDTYYWIRNGEVETNCQSEVNGAMIRVFDGDMWYTSVTNDLEEIQTQIDQLAALARENPDIYSHPVIRNFGSQKAGALKCSGEHDIRKITREQREKLVADYVSACVDPSIAELTSYLAGCTSKYVLKEYYSSKGAEIRQDAQRCSLTMNYEFTVDGITSCIGKVIQKFSFEELQGWEQEILEERDRYLDYARNAVDVEPGEYTCVLAPAVTAMFTHESFGHKSESDFMLNDSTLQEEWVIGKKVGDERVSICDDGGMEHNGYTPYDDEGNEARETWLIRKGVLTGRLHDSKSAAALNEEITGNSRAENYTAAPMVRMTNTYMEKGSDDSEKIIRGVEDGIYVYNVNYGTGSSTFTMQPNLCYRIRSGRLCEPVRVNVLTGSVFRTLFDIDAVGNDLEIFDFYLCGKGDQMVDVSAGGPTIRVKKLTVN